MDGVQVFVLKGIEMTIVSRPGAVLGVVYHMCGSIVFLATAGRLSRLPRVDKIKRDNRSSPQSPPCCMCWQCSFTFLHFF